MSTQLLLDGVNRSFDGFKAINDLSLAVEKGELRAIIGPNGAGKTTMMDIITGKTRPDTGRVMWNQSVDLTRTDEAGSARLGIGRKFQKPTVFETQTVEDNIALALKEDRSVWATLFHRRSAEDTRRIGELLELVKLSHVAGWMAGDLSHGQKQWLEIGMLLAQDPELLLVDEPAAGMTDAETMRTAELLRQIAGRHTVIVVEHDMDFVRALDCRVTVLHQGHVLAEGSLDHVSANEQVIEVYLGR
ncbi:urea ABC transporter ATP-binding protein UrtD [Mangrovicoccus algicola]|uniref:Urea ABC transporter ATP-binding protein UrtD n=1 Tax=Mangrovicoccus algicola TaxID=2771008 RepID=A0A8J6YXZ8_9RHOB|nr:urea ABC transporter ATP-binding protein UrtD [Mangrovicoccus algicola]MBE3639817.1 urea ABC transporter ATP-binding protein UrtD [Mangrovicoccus algicola]